MEDNDPLNSLQVREACAGLPVICAITPSFQVELVKISSLLLKQSA